MIDTALMVWRVVTSLGTGGRVAAIVVLLDILLLAGFLLYSIWKAFRSKVPGPVDMAAQDATHYKEWRDRIRE